MEVANEAIEYAESNSFDRGFQEGRNEGYDVARCEFFDWEVKINELEEENENLKIELEKLRNSVLDEEDDEDDEDDNSYISERDEDDDGASFTPSLHYR